MASFAKIGLNSKVIEVLSVHNDVLKDAVGDQQEAIGVDFLTKLTGWEYNNSCWFVASYIPGSILMHNNDTKVHRHLSILL